MHFPLGDPSDKRVMRHFNDPTIGGTLASPNVAANAETILDPQPAFGTFDQEAVNVGLYDHHGEDRDRKGRVLRSGSVRSEWPKS